MGKMINHGMPFSVEERDDLARRFAAGQSVGLPILSETVFAIEVRLEQLGLIKPEPDESVEHDVRQATDNSVYESAEKPFSCALRQCQIRRFVLTVGI